MTKNTTQHIRGTLEIYVFNKSEPAIFVNWKLILLCTVAMTSNISIKQLWRSFWKTELENFFAFVYLNIYFVYL